MISSASNPQIKSLINLRSKSKARQEQGLFLVEGAREIGRAIQSGYEVEQIYFCAKVLSEAGRVCLDMVQKAPIEVEHRAFEKLAVRENQDGLVASFKMRSHTPGEIVNSAGFFVIAENIEKPGNLGAILRSVDGAGATGVILTGSSVDSFNPNVIRSSLGTRFSVPTASCSNEEVLKLCREANINLVAATPNAEHIYTDFDYKRPVGIVLGSEADGLSSFWDMCERVAIPMHGIADSLNVSVSAAILLYEIARQP